MRGFSEKHGLTFPGAGADGGALSAVAPYTSGTFGSFFGTPTFVVIDPEGNVNFKVPMQDLRAAIEDALSGDSGCANAFGGNINSNGSDPQVLISSDIQGSQTYTLPVDDMNNYAYQCEFQLPPMSLDFDLHVEEDGDDLAGVSVRDIIMITRHLLGITFFESTEQKIAADYTANGVLSARDISEMRKLLVGLDAENEYHNSWIYWHETTDFSNDTTGVLIPDLVTSVRLSDVVDSLVTGNFKGVKIGDVSGEINPFLKDISTRGDHHRVHFEDRWVKEGEWVDVALISESPISGIQLGLQMPATTTVSGDDNWTILAHSDEGVLKVVAHTPTGDQADLKINLMFQAISSGMISSQLKLDDALTPLAATESSEAPVRLLPLSDGSTPYFSPNPTSGELFVRSGIPMKEIWVLTNDGRVISSITMGENCVQERIELPNKGVYMVQVIDMQGSVHVEQVIRQ
jgi:hypothetical protein